MVEIKSRGVKHSLSPFAIVKLQVFQVAKDEFMGFVDLNDKRRLKVDLEGEPFDSVQLCYEALKEEIGDLTISTEGGTAPGEEQDWDFGSFEDEYND